MKKTVKVKERVVWTCNYCQGENDSSGWVFPGDKVQCSACRAIFKVANRYRDPMPEVVPVPKERKRCRKS